MPAVALRPAVYTTAWPGTTSPAQCAHSTPRKPPRPRLTPPASRHRATTPLPRGPFTGGHSPGVLCGPPVGKDSRLGAGRESKPANGSSEPRAGLERFAAASGRVGWTSRLGGQRLKAVAGYVSGQGLGVSAGCWTELASGFRLYARHSLGGARRHLARRGPPRHECERREAGASGCAEEPRTCERLSSTKCIVLSLQCRASSAEPPVPAYSARGATGTSGELAARDLPEAALRQRDCDAECEREARGCGPKSTLICSEHAPDCLFRAPRDCGRQPMLGVAVCSWDVVGRGSVHL